MKTPEGCKSCEYKEPSEGGWCYMFEIMPEDECMQWRKRMWGMGRRIYTDVTDWIKSRNIP